MARRRLSEKSRAILRMIGEGKSYEQIVVAGGHWSYMDVIAAAREALALDAMGSAVDGGETRGDGYSVAEVRRRHPRAYEPWTEDEEARLCGMVLAGRSVAQIAGELGRERGAIRSRIVRLGIVERLSENERARLERNIERE